MAIATGPDAPIGELKNALTVTASLGDFAYSAYA